MALQQQRAVAQQQQQQQEQEWQQQMQQELQQQEDAEQRRQEHELWRQQQLQVVACGRADAEKQQRIGMQQQTGIGTPSHHTKENRQGHVFRRCKDLDYILYII